MPMVEQERIDVEDIQRPLTRSAERHRTVELRDQHRI